ncbi:zona pellucida sperm-binding protein 3-like isoform X1 [Conger conger]|uniref:zona pellucida sperm-binding protein 3-like isoform X1 n=1 Tax=Conger conger TaxID=82655 RepID=UPI002A5A2649|nr:zona pellucida sperm-binding protein 3-like isoform X1 [Conger conger]
MGLVDWVLGRAASLLLISVLVDCVPLSPRTFTSSGKMRKLHKRPGQASPTAPALPPPRTVTVQCHDSAMEVAVKADLFGTGAVIDSSDLRLGPHPLGKGGKCGAVTSGEGQYTILAGLTDCGTELVFTNEWLVYKNSIFYSPTPLPDGVIRLEETMIPIKCHYRRQYSVSSNDLEPTWVPFSARQSSEEAIYFTLRLLTADWRSEGTSNVYFLGDVINLEASVVQGNHAPLRVFVDTCMATLVPDVNSHPRYTFIEGGCLTDARATGSRSRFLPRTRDDHLRLELDAFRMHQDSRDSIYITCLVTAEPVELSTGSPNQACSYVDGRWTSADERDQACGSCEGFHGFSSSKRTPEVGVWKRGAKADTGAAGTAGTKPPAAGSASAKTVTIGPLIVHSLGRAEHSGNSADASDSVAEAGSAVDPSAIPPEAGTAVDTPRSLEDLATGQMETATLPLTGRSAHSADARPAISLEAGTLGTSGLETESLDDLEIESWDDLDTERWLPTR